MHESSRLIHVHLGNLHDFLLAQYRAKRSLLHEMSTSSEPSSSTFEPQVQNRYVRIRCLLFMNLGVKMHSDLHVSRYASCTPI